MANVASAIRVVLNIGSTSSVACAVQIYVKSSVLSQAPDLAISAHLMTEAEIDAFVDENMLVIHPDECIDCGVCVP